MIKEKKATNVHKAERGINLVTNVQRLVKYSGRSL